MFKMTPENQKWWILIAMTSCISMIFLDVTVLPVALPTIHRDIGLTQLGFRWVVNAYILTLTLFVIAGGRLGDRYGSRGIFLLGLLIFSIGSVLCGLSTNQFILIWARIIQGTGAALLIPCAISNIFKAFPEMERGKAMGLYISVGSIFLMLGPFIGGVFTEFINWRLIFFINIPIAIVGYCLTLFAVPKPEPLHRKFDLLGFFLASLGICGIVIPLIMAETWGWSSFLTLGMLIVGLVLIVFLILVDRKVEDPYINFSFFQNPQFSGAVIASFSTQFIIMITVFWAIYFQTIFGYSPTQAGTISLLAYAPIILMAPIAGRLFDRFGPFFSIFFGFVIIAGSLFWFVLNIENRSILYLLGTVLPFGCALPLILTTSMTHAINQIEYTRRGLATGTVMMLRQLGGTIGLAIMSSFFFWVQEKHFERDLKMHTETTSLDPNAFHGLLAGAEKAQKALASAPEKAQIFVKKAYADAYIDAFWSINVLAICVAVLGFFFSLFLIRKKRI